MSRGRESKAEYVEEESVRVRKPRSKEAGVGCGRSSGMPRCQQRAGSALSAVALQPRGGSAARHTPWEESGVENLLCMTWSLS